MITFDSQFKVGVPFMPARLPDAEVKGEPMFFNSSLGFAYQRGGPITREFLTAFRRSLGPEVDLRDCVFDSRVHMLMKGWFPCIPGFHHDDVPRGDNGQPNYRYPAYRAKHVLGLVNGHICPTEFAVGRVEVSDPEQHPLVYKAWHVEVEEAVRQGTLRSVDAPSGRLVHFDSDAFHQGVRAVADGWRWFGRISWDTERVTHITDETRAQVQVYMENPFEGW